MKTNNLETISAQATATGKAGVGIIRVSGSKALEIAEKIIHRKPRARYAHYLAFFDQDDEIIDYGIVLFFPAPHSFTGEDIVEFQAHGGPVILSLIQKQVLAYGARPARPGEFSERAFLNDKIDLSQAEAIADLIDSSSEQAAKSALRSLRGDFSRQIQSLDEKIVDLRIYVEAAIDFPQEEIDFLSDGVIEKKIIEIRQELQKILHNANQGSILVEGMNIAIAGQPNAGKSSLLNALTGEDLAIVTDIAGTTRDILRQQIHIDGIPLHIIDTAGIRESDCKVEQIGIQKAKETLKSADKILLMVDVETGLSDYEQEILQLYSNNCVLIYNKIDKLGVEPKIDSQGQVVSIYLSVKQQKGLELLKNYLKQSIGFSDSGEGIFSARSRHLRALEKAQEHIQLGLQQLQQYQAGELLAEELLLAHQQLSEILGQFCADDLLGKIFAGFCIGK